MKKFVVAAVVVVLGTVGLWAVAGRSTGELKGYVRASADTAVDGVTGSLPREVHDRKLDHEFRQVRQELIDSQVKMNLSQRQIDTLRTEITQLEDSTRRRERLLAEAYPVLRTATDGQLRTVRFANAEYSLAEFQREIDDLLSLQDRETRQLSIKRDGLARLEKSLSDGLLAVAEMKSSLETAEQEVALLRSRREQAETESATLDLITDATTGHESTGSLLRNSLDGLNTTLISSKPATKPAAPPRRSKSVSPRTASAGTGTAWKP